MTPGPWHLHPDGKSVWAWHKEIATVSYSPDSEDAPSELLAKTNAHLIAAAPDLLEACQAARHSLLRLAVNDLTTHDRINQLDAAIAKALNQKGKLNETH